MPFLLWLTILSCQLQSLLCSSSASSSSLPLSHCVSFFFSLRFSGSTTLSFLPLSSSLLFSVFSVVYQLLSTPCLSHSVFIHTFLAASAASSPISCPFSCPSVRLFAVFLNPPLWDLRGHSQPGKALWVISYPACAAVHFQHRLV